MKKLIVILMVLAIVASFAFADGPDKTDSNGTSRIDIKTSIGQEYPQYQLKVISITENKGTIKEAIAVKDGTNGEVEINTDDLLEGSAAVGFEINQIVNSRTNVSYDLSVKATDLILNVTTGEGANATTGPKANPDDDEKFSVSLTTTFATTDADTDLLTITPVTTKTGNFAGTDGGFTVQYLNGKFVNVETDTQGTIKQIGTFSYTWGQNRTAKVGDYTATVTMVVTAK